MLCVCCLLIKVPCFGWDVCMVGSGWAKSCMLVHIYVFGDKQWSLSANLASF